MTWRVYNSEADLEGHIADIDVVPANTSIPGIAKDVTLKKAGDGFVEGVQKVPASAHYAKLSVKGVWVRDGKTIVSDWKSGEAVEPTEKCNPTTPPTETPKPGEPTPILTQDCTTITIGLDNPANGKTITLHFKTSKGEQRTTVIAPGEKKSEKFSATPGFTVTVTAEGIDGGSETIPYQKPADCGNGATGSGSGGGLPVTGAAASSIAGGAALLLAIGGVLFFMARRRKVKFTA